MEGNNDNANIMNLTLIERKFRLPQIRGVQGRRHSILLRALGNKGDEVTWAFLLGKKMKNLKDLYISPIEEL